ncbi:PREDICTED: protein MIZU-KUSSEI 1 [Nelumbo nucifera]|uniref:Protein MIZU-KUSSEI 1 n=2 Tax=Nelumbo nucifera TaxID=4432 RepID=A0A1U8BCC9_NELNU|nr:PREDICTED: protein MIZU-KUSSEI 1 [Nelumbo nucifera]DAD41013.1 TPA_asm: hypothetical protein HUJ06_015336 [Nelumbo nucifera]
MSHRTSDGGGVTNIVNGVTVVDCEKQVRSWRLLRSFLELLIPSCNCTTYLEQQREEDVEARQGKYMTNNYYNSRRNCNSTIIKTTVTGTIYGHRRGKVSFCIQANPETAPIILLELAVSTALLAKEMESGLVRITLECNLNSGTSNLRSSALLSVPLWTMYCNGRKVGFAIRRRPTQADMDILWQMRSVFVGTGIISGKEELDGDNELIYLRAKFNRVTGSSNSESFHFINPDLDIDQDLSIFFLRTQ